MKTKIFILICCIFLIACQTPGKTVKVEKSDTCPNCKTITKTTAIKNINYKTHTCPHCHSDFDYDNLSHDPDATTHACSKCKKGVSMCPECKKKRGY